MPIKMKNIPQQEDIAHWPYSKEVCLPRIKAEVGLLIGAHIPKAIEPRQVINSECEEPYADKTALGWVINGPLRKEDVFKSASSTLQGYPANRFSVVEIEELFLMQCKTGFPE